MSGQWKVLSGVALLGGAGLGLWFLLRNRPAAGAPTPPPGPSTPSPRIPIMPLNAWVLPDPPQLDRTPSPYTQPVQIEQPSGAGAAAYNFQRDTMPDQTHDPSQGEAYGNPNARPTGSVQRLTTPAEVRRSAPFYRIRGDRWYYRNRYSAGHPELNQPQFANDRSGIIEVPLIVALGEIADPSYNYWV